MTLGPVTSITMTRPGLSLLLLFSLVDLSACKLCPNAIPSNGTFAIRDNDTIIAVLLQCPSSGYPEDHTECCPTKANVQPQCCLPERQFHEIENRVAMAIAITVISCCITVAVLVIVCCFWSRCPLYNTCRARYTESDVVTYGPTDDASNMMPSEPDNKAMHIYAPNNFTSGAAV